MNNFIFLNLILGAMAKSKKIELFCQIHSNEKILYFLRQMIEQRSFQLREYNKKYFLKKFLKKYISSVMFDFVDDGKVCTY